MVWIRPGVALARPVESAVFDVDGVLIDTTGSYRLSVIAATDYLVGIHLGLWQHGEGERPPVTPEDVAAFKLAGGFNNDWDLTFALTGLLTARLREWRGQPEAALSLAEWAALAQQAMQQGQGGIAWARRAIPPSAQIDYDLAERVHDEFYWGAHLLRELVGREPRYVMDAPGLVHNERVLAPATLLRSLFAGGMRHFALITGRLGAEVPWAIRLLGAQLAPPTASWPLIPGPWGSSPFEVIVPCDQIAKPDPAALALVAGRLGTVQGLYVGDTADDLALVLNYRQVAGAEQPPFLAVMIASGREAEVYRARGADLVLAQIGELPGALAQIGAISQMAGEHAQNA